MSANRRLCAPHRDDVRAIVEDALRPISLGILTRAPGRRFYPAGVASDAHPLKDRGAGEEPAAGADPGRSGLGSAPKH